MLLKNMSVKIFINVICFDYVTLMVYSLLLCSGDKICCISQVIQQVAHQNLKYYYYSEEDDSSGENDDEKRNSGSRSKVEHCRVVLNRFTEYKKFMLCKIKLDELLNFPTIKNANLRFSTNVKDECIKKPKVTWLKK